MPNSTFVKLLMHHPPAAPSYHTATANTHKKTDPHEVESQHAQRPAVKTEDNWNTSNRSVVSGSSRTTDVSPSHSDKYVKQNNKRSKNIHNFLYIVDVIKNIAEVLLPAINIVYLYPSYAISVRSWLDYLIGSHTVNTLFGSQGVFKTILLLEEYDV